MAAQGTFHPAAVGQMTRATLHTMRKAVAGRKSGEASAAARSVKRRTGKIRRKKAKRATALAGAIRKMRRSRKKLEKGSTAMKRKMAKLRARRKK